jgi:hypothetical protein
MQGFVQTAFGIKPVNLTNIQSVSYYTNRDSYFMQENEDLLSVTTGSLVIEYIGNATGYRNSGGNIVLGLDYYQDEYYPVERFWAWVRDVSAGSVTKTFNQYLNSSPVYGVSTFAVTDFAPVSAYVIKLSDDQTIQDGCGLEFKTQVYPELGPTARPNYLTVLTDGNSSFPEIGHRVFLDQTQGFNPNSFGGGVSPEVPEAMEPVEGPPEAVPFEYEKVVETANSSMSTSPIIADGRYAWLDGTPQWETIEFAPGAGPITISNPQQGMVYEVIIKSGRIHDVSICEADFDVFNAVKDVPGKAFSRYKRDVIAQYPNYAVNQSTVESGNCACWIYSEPQVNKVVGEDSAPSDMITAGIAGSGWVCTAGSYGGLGLTVEENPWYDVTLGFTDLPVAQIVDEIVPDTGTVKQIVCPTVGQGSNPENLMEEPEGFMDAASQFQNAMLATVPVGAKVWILCSDSKYRPFSMEGGYSVKAKYRKYYTDPAIESPYPANLRPVEPAEYEDITLPREILGEDLAVPPKWFEAEPARNGEAAVSVTTVVPANPEAGIPVELTKTCYYFGYDPAVVAQHPGEILYNQFTTDSQGKIANGSICEKSIFAGASAS